MTEPENVADLWASMAVELAPTRLDLSDPAALFRSSGFEPDAAQVEVLTTEAQRVIINWARQSGKTTVVACRAAWRAQSHRGQTVVIVAGRQEQAKHLLRACRRFSGRDSSASGTMTELSIRFRNDSHVVVVPASDTARGLSASELVVEEASVVPDDVYDSVLTPMVSTTHGPIILLGTPGSESGFFWELWTNAPRWEPGKPATGHAWLKSLRTWEECDRIDPWTVEELRQRSERAYKAEYMCRFAGAADALFDPDHIREMVTEEFEPTHFLETL